MNAVPAPAPEPPASASASAPAQAVPLLRTLLLTDLADSTGTIERLGDGPSAELFRAHDRLVLELQQRWRGRLIDRSDGLLLMFERAIDGLGFALDYHRGLRELGRAHGVPLQARAGLHVGEVLTWRNSPEAVAVGAKPLEVEGLAKPLAGRLLGLARPGQILLSATAEALAHRAARELGERGAQLAWKSHGRWRFKGLPEPLEVYEAGEPGLAPLQAPRPDAKAWRDIPAWRRPAALAAELALVAVIGIGAWFFTRPQPAIAFAERDWVVVADMRNLTGQPVLDESLQQAFRISLEQSRHVNVLSDLKARDTLARMQRQPGTALDREIASEIAVRDGARAVILPTVAEVGGRVRVSAEVIDPQSQTTVYAEYADGSGLDSVLASVDTVTAALRGRLGEELKAIERDSEPLPQVTTSNLDALRAYALGVKALNARKYSDAIKLFEHAIERDPGFALARLGLARTFLAADDPEPAMRQIEAASKLARRLTRRDQLYAQAWAARMGPVEPMLQKWKMLAELYPDYYAAHQNFALWSWFYANEYMAGVAGLEQAASSPQNAHRALYFDTLAYLQLAQERYAAAEASVNASLARDPALAVSTKSILLAVRGRHAEARALREEVDSGDLDAGKLVSMVNDVAIAVDQGNYDRAHELVEHGISRSEGSPHVNMLYRYLSLELKAQLGQPVEVTRGAGPLLDEAIALATDVHGQAKHDALFVALATGLSCARVAQRSCVERTLEETKRHVASSGYPNLERAHVVLQAELARLDGDTSRAIRLLKGEMNPRGLYQAHVALMRAYDAAEDDGAAEGQAAWLVSHRGRAYVEWLSYGILRVANVADARKAAGTAPLGEGAMH